MHFHPTPLAGVFRIEIERHDDERGYFARTWCDREAAAFGLRTPMVQDSIAFNHRQGTLRGLHYHASPFPQARLLRCVAGAAFIAIVDLRRDAGAYLETLAVTIEDDRHTALYVPPGLALGYQTLRDGTVVQYKMPEYYDSSYERGVRWNDPTFNIEWPNQQPILNARDASYPDFNLDMHP